MHKFAIFDRYDVMLNSEAYNQLLDEKNDLEQKLKESNNAMNSRMDSLQGQMDNLTSFRNRSNIEKTIYDYFNANFKEDILKEEEIYQMEEKNVAYYVN